MKRFVQIQNGDRTIYGELYLPEGESVCPVVIMSHGYNGSSADFEKEGNFFAANGVIAIAYDFCGGSAHAKSTGVYKGRIKSFQKRRTWILPGSRKKSGRSGASVDKQIKNRAA